MEKDVPFCTTWDTVAGCAEVFLPSRVDRRVGVAGGALGAFAFLGRGVGVPESAR